MPLWLNKPGFRSEAVRYALCVWRVIASDAQSHGILADGSRHAEQAGIDVIATHTLDVGVAPVAAQDAQPRRTHEKRAESTSETAICTPPALPAFARRNLCGAFEDGD